MEDLAEDRLSDDYCSQTNDDGAAAHVDIGKALVLGKQCTRKSYKTIGYHQTKNTAEISVDSLCSCHFVIASGSTQGASHLSSKEPVQNCDQHYDDHCHKKDRIFIERDVLNKTQGHQKLVFVYIDGLIRLSHNFQVHGPQTKLC